MLCLDQQIKWWFYIPANFLTLPGGKAFLILLSDCGEMSAKIVLSSETSSAKFNDRVLILNSEPVKVSRSSRDEKPDTHNAIFDCRVRTLFLILLYKTSYFRFCPSLRQFSVSRTVSFTWWTPVVAMVALLTTSDWASQARQVWTVWCFPKIS